MSDTPIEYREMMSIAAEQQMEAVRTGKVTLKGKTYPLSSLFRCYFCGEYITLGQAKLHFGSREENKVKVDLERDLAEARAEIERKDKLIEQMRNCHNCRYYRPAGEYITCISLKPCEPPTLEAWEAQTAPVKAALSAAERK